MAKPKGSAKTGGRTKNTPNKVTSVTREIVAGLLTEMLPEVKLRMQNLDDAEYCKLFKDLLPYAVAKIQPTPPDATQTATTELEEQLANLYGRL